MVSGCNFEWCDLMIVIFLSQVKVNQFRLVIIYLNDWGVGSDLFMENMNIYFYRIYVIKLVICNDFDCVDIFCVLVVNISCQVMLFVVFVKGYECRNIED